MAYLIDFSYDTEPLARKVSLSPVMGPFSLLGESQANYLGQDDVQVGLLEPHVERF